MTYDPTRHHRRSIRLRGYDYSLPGAYFVTLCVRDRQPVFGEVVAGRVRPSRVGKVAYAFWANIPEHVPEVVLDAFVVMPNHVHGIIGITDREPDDGPSADRDHDGNDNHGGGRNRGAGDRRGENDRRRGVQLNAPTMHGTGAARSHYAALSPKRGTLSVIIRTYKGAVTRWCRQNGHSDFAWLPRFYDHIIRDERALHNIRRYIAENPMRWHLDRLNPRPPSR